MRKKSSAEARRRLLAALAGPLGKITVARSNQEDIEYLIVRSTGIVIGPAVFEGYPIVYERVPALMAGPAR